MTSDCFVAALLAMTISFTATAQAGVILKVTAENPSSYEERQVSVRSYLPSGVKPENIIDKGELEVAYDVKQGQYYVYKDATLAPLASVTYQIEVQDIWRIDEAQLPTLKSHSQDLTDKLAKTEYSGVAATLNDAVANNIAAILKRQAASSIDKVAPVEHINAYEANKKLFEDIRKNVGIMENLVIGLGGDTGKIMGESTIGARAVNEVAEEADMSAGSSEGGSSGKEAAKPKTIVLKIEVSNPSATEKRSIPVNYYLPPEIRKDDIIDAKELEPRLDFEKSVYYLYHPGVELGPGESRVFEIVVKDKWSVSEANLLAMKLHAAAMVATLSGTKEFSAIEELGKQAMQKIDDILNKQSAETLDEEHVADFYSQQRQVGDIEKIIGRMEDLLRQAGASPKVTVLDESKIKELAEGSGVSPERMKQIQKMLIEGKTSYGTGPDTKGVRLLAGTIFKGKAPSTATTWKIIYIILICLGVVSALFYFSQFEQRQIAMFDPLTGAFTRKYIMERFREEIRIAKGAGIECSLLLLDVDKFKNINDTHGHTVGDVILKEFVIAIRKGIRATDPVGRFGGDEFLVVLPTANKDKAVSIAENIRKLIEGHDVKIEDRSFKITSSVGVATYPRDSLTADDMFDKADHAMYESKAGGGNAVTANV